MSINIRDVFASRLENADALAAAVARVPGVPVHLAAAMVETESGGRNVFGNDAGGVFSTPLGPDIEVTPERYAEFYARAIQPKVDAGGDLSAGEPSNGVGPSQITWWEFHAKARAAGLDLADPEDNIVCGLELLQDYLEREDVAGDIARAATVYNAGSLRRGVTDYGRLVAQRAELWRQELDALALQPAPAPVAPESPGEDQEPTLPENGPEEGVQPSGEVVVEETTEEVVGQEARPIRLETDGTVVTETVVTIVRRHKKYPRGRARG